MVNKSIGICGSPLVGKLGILEAFATFGQINKKINYRFEIDNTKFEVIRCLKTVIDNNILIFYTTFGAIFYEPQTFEHILSKVDIVIYVFSSSKRVIVQHQIDRFNLYVTIAKKIKKLWTDVPWIVVVTDINTTLDKITFPNIEIPVQLQNNIVPIALHYLGNQGVDLLLDKILYI
jgi:hypothetical protein